jgi:Apea-like HEPN
MPTLLFDPGRLFSQVKRALRDDLPFSQMTSEIALEIQAMHWSLKNSDLGKVGKLSDQMLSLDALPHSSSLLFLGYFAILESLLAHAPNPTDTIDSITRQVKRKLALLSNRWQPRLDYAVFGEATPDSIWSQMYAYRSALAHGGEPDFEKKLKLLNPSSALALLRQAVTAVLRQAIKEPQLIADLRSC